VLLEFYKYPAEHWIHLRTTNPIERVALVRAGAIFHKGKLLERPIDSTAEPSTAEPETAGTEVA
jgi:putative transposase